MSVAALAVMAGHAYPVFLRFQGRQGGRQFVGAFLCLTPLALAADSGRLRGGGRVDATYLVGFDRRRRHLPAGRLDPGQGAGPGDRGIGYRRGIHHLQA